MRKALEDLRKIIEIPDQKHWNYVEMRQSALEDWIKTWIIEIEYEQSVLNQRYLSSDFEDFLKEHIGKSLVEQVLEDAVEITKKNTMLKGNLVCLRRKAKKE